MIERGDRVTVQTAGGDEVEMVALSPMERGMDFVVVWVCTPAEWERAERESREPEGIPWPAEAIVGLSNGSVDAVAS